jgi:hypothetical protein
VAVSLTGVTIGGVGDYMFEVGDANLSLAPHGRIVVAKNLAAFAAAYPLVPSASLASREYLGTLDNGGETITLRDAAGGLIQAFTFDDDWHKETDGDGFSLVAIDTSGNYDEAANWRSSALAGGSPGTADAAPLAGDFTGDGVVDRKDAALLARNFGRATGSHRGRGDLTGDGVTNLLDLAALQAALSGIAPSPAASADAVMVGARSTATAIDRAVEDLTRHRLLAVRRRADTRIAAIDRHEDDTSRVRRANDAASGDMLALSPTSRRNRQGERRDGSSVIDALK